MHRPVAVGFVVIVLVAAGMVAGAPLATGGPGGTSTAGASATLDDGSATVDPDATGLQETDQEFDRTTFDVVVHGDGSATWTFKHVRVLSSEEDVEQFESYAETFEAEETDQYDRFTESAAALTSSGQDYTGREMEATDFDRSASVNRGLNDEGIVEMSFTWTNFATVGDDGRVVVSDVFSGGLPLVSDQTLSFSPGDGLVFERAQPESAAEYNTATLGEANTVWWDGPYEFGDGQPHIVFVPADATGTAGSSGGGGMGAATSGLVGALVLALVGLVAVAWYRSGWQRPEVGSMIGGSSPITGSGGPADEPPEEPAISSEELMTDEDRVIALIRQSGGRMKQVKIVEETGWSKSKVSMLLSEMADDGTISKLRVGRENIISLDGFEPEATKSPFDE